MAFAAVLGTAAVAAAVSSYYAGGASNLVDKFFARLRRLARFARQHGQFRIDSAGVVIG
jgi:hypothetical protein